MQLITENYLIYGPLGLTCIILLYAVITLYRSKEKLSKECTEDKEKLHKEYQTEIMRLVSEHKKEQDALITQYITKAERWVEKGNELAANLAKVLDALSERKEKRS